jgi:hypothetical protein
MDERDLISRFVGEPALDPDARDRARRMLDAEIRGRPRLVRPIGVAAAVIVAVLVVALVWSTSRPQSAAASALEQLAAIETPTLQPGPGEYLHRVSVEFRTETSEILGGDTFRVQVLLRTDQWLAADGSGEARTRVEEVSFPSAEDAHAWSDPGAPPLPVTGEHRSPILFAPGEGPLIDPASIPLDPEALLAALRDGSIRPHAEGDANVFAQIGDLLAQGNLPATTRAALLDAASHLQGVTLLGRDEDPLGRLGEGFSVRSDTTETRLIFDPSSGELLAVETYEPPGRAATLVDWQAFRTYELVAQIRTISG